MEFMYNGNLVSWTGDSWIDESTLSAREFRNLSRLNGRAYLCRFQAIVDGSPEAERILSLETSNVLQLYQDVFEEPSTLPPTRSQDHRIHLPENATPMDVRPYCYPQY